MGLFCNSDEIDHQSQVVARTELDCDPIGTASTERDSIVSLQGAAALSDGCLGEPGAEHNAREPGTPPGLRLRLRRYVS